jgi:hypothetical protein
MFTALFIKAKGTNNQGIQWQKDTQNVVYSYSEILFILNTKENSDICCDMDESKDFMLNEINQSQKDKNCMSPLIWDIVVKFMKTETRPVMPGVREGEEQGIAQWVQSFSLGMNSKTELYT